MIAFETIILQFAENGDKTGWTYIQVPAHLAAELKPGHKRSFRVKGMLDGLAIAGVALLPQGEGNFIMPVNAQMRKGIRKGEGAMLQVQLQEDKDFKIEVPDDLAECLEYEPEAGEYFYGLTPSHRGYFVKWIDSAKTQPIRDKRIALTVNALMNRWDYGQMIRASRKE
ncbi:YdeI/OmpD-associated family protein [Mucilaginibacter sp. UR6-1]|uniref:YdeI/OmpD-associated family protein n=1 Tax=Mucilaginibacter sp. UR6-1 TaxID=1435643 RepID=UPI001E6427E5|nr:YdeI/OmpD-associated family protein [Mucilaginibacter sp. UR6-1]MCC8409673.1 YdeI/OmpD-associated family protein [Mucilaginibacter sp. UR6-1]